MKVICPWCDGVGSSGRWACEVCEGAGTVEEDTAADSSVSNDEWEADCGCSFKRTPDGGWLYTKCRLHWLD
jgi:hypothetical protein